jgi:hypothetical protein
MKAIIVALFFAAPAHAEGLDMLHLYDNAPPKIERISHVSKPKAVKAKKKKQNLSIRLPVDCCLIVVFNVPFPTSRADRRQLRQMRDV